MGSANSRISVPGTAPMKGPKMGIMFVTPTSTPISGAKSSPMMDMSTKVSMPTRSASIIWPPIYPLNVLFAIEKTLSTLFATRGGTAACSTARRLRRSVSLLASI